MPTRRPAPTASTGRPPVCRRNGVWRGLTEQLIAAASDAGHAARTRQLGDELRAALGTELKAHFGELLHGGRDALESGRLVAEHASEGLKTLLASLEHVDERARDAARAVVAERIDAAIHDAVATIDRRLQDETIAPQLAVLTEAFVDADTRLGQLRAYVDTFGPGGLPVVAQKAQHLEARVAELEQELTAQRAEASALREGLAAAESKAIQSRLASPVDPETLQRKLSDLRDGEQKLAEREVLASENDRLRRENEGFKSEIEKWGVWDREHRAVEVDRDELVRARDKVAQLEETAATERDKSSRAGKKVRTVMTERDRLRSELDRLEEDRAAASARDARLSELEESNQALRVTNEDARREATALNRQLAELRGTLTQTERALEDERRQRQDDQQSVRRALSQDLEAHRESMTKDLEEWAKNEANRLAAAHRANAERLDALAKKLDDKLKTATTQLHDALEQRTAAVARAAALDQSLASLSGRLSADMEAYRAVVDDGVEALRAQAQARGEIEVDTARDKAQAWEERAKRATEEASALETAMAGLEAKRARVEEELGILRDRVNELRVKDVPDEERLAQLRQPVFAAAELAPVATADQTSEEDWLKEIEEGIADAGFVFHPRLLRAFHTSLKIADQAPLTLLEGISGTGKSELPRLYADLGGLPILEVAVQPSWDSPQDLFGFFNYTDGRVKAEPLARLLHQLNCDNGDGELGKSPLIVLLDEMNLARVEYYFAELLSKLEARRSVRGQDSAAARRRASIMLDTGPGQPAFELYPDPRAMFVGTMNDDESTLTLSPKVLDRACVLTFPAPKDLRMTAQDGVARRQQRLSYETWKSWTRPDGDDPKLKTWLSDLNEVMTELDLGFGHRLFRAIHAYVANYPGTDTMEYAKADQFAMKIIPRLRGLECEERKVRHGLDALEPLVPSALRPAFQQARAAEFFRWSGTADLFRPTDGSDT